MLFTARLLPRGGPRKVTDRFNDVTLDGVKLASGLAGKKSVEGDGVRIGGGALGLSRVGRVGRHCCWW